MTYKTGSIIERPFNITLLFCDLKLNLVNGIQRTEDGRLKTEFVLERFQGREHGGI
jgi:hypothetical protein